MQAELLVCKGNVLAVPPVIPCFGAAEEQDCAAVVIDHFVVNIDEPFELELAEFVLSRGGAP